MLYEKAPAKINLTLDVLHKRPDGFHEVEMIMTTVDLADRVWLRPTDDGKITIKRQNDMYPMIGKTWLIKLLNCYKTNMVLQMELRLRLKKVFLLLLGLRVEVQMLLLHYGA